MNILVIENEDVTRGAAISLRVLLRNLKTDRNVDITVMQVSENSNAAFYDSLGIRHFVGGQTSHVTEYNGSISRLRLLSRLIKRGIKAKRADKTAYERLKKAVDLNKIDIVYTNIDRYSIGHLINKKDRIPHVVHLREFGDIDFGAVSAIPDSHRRLDKNVSRYIAISEAVKKHYVDFGISPDKISVIYNGVENKFRPQDNRAGSPDSRLKIVVAGAVIPTKGQLDVVKAVALLPEDMRRNIQIDFWGKGDPGYMEKIGQTAENAGVQAFLKGQTAALNEILPEYDVGITCSKAEAFGRVTVEYMMAGLYVIASDTGANPEIVGRETDQLYKWGNAGDLAEHIKWAFENREEAQDIADRSLKYASKNFNDKLNAERVYEIFKRQIKA